MIPTVEDVGSAPLVHRFGDMFNLPGLTNFLGTVQADLDIAGIRSLNFPPFATSDTVTGCLYLNGKFFKATGSPITFRWYPDRIEREAAHDGFLLHSTTVLAPGTMAALVRLAIENRSGRERDVVMKFGLQGGVTKALRAWTSWAPPVEEDNERSDDIRRGAFIFHARASAAASVQGINPPPASRTDRSLSVTFRLLPGERKEVVYVNALGETPGAAEGVYDRLMRDPSGIINGARELWNDELRAVFTPGNDRYSGSLPELETTDRDLLRIYHTGILGVVSFRRDTPFSAIGRAYDTLLPKWWLTVTFLWDYSLSSLVHALLDPAVMRKYLELWMRTDIHTCFGTEYLTGGPVGPWYSANDFAISVLARDYLRWSGDTGWLGREPSSAGGGSGPKKTVADFIYEYAENWKRFRQPGGLADYGGILNLLECVSTYVHQVASLNAGNVFSLRFAADVAETLGDMARAEVLRAEAADLVRNILPLYNEGKGFWRARFPDGRLVDVRHCYDFFTVLNTIGDDLSDRHRAEMVEFFKREFYAPTWMHALSCDDDDAMFSVRPDHQWNGAYPAWPPQAVLALYRCGEDELALRWLHGLARSANQGPFGQAHFVDSIVRPDAGGARKAPIDFPYITDWTVSSGGSWVSAIIEGTFGVHAPVGGGLAAHPRFATLDPDSELRNLPHRGKLYHVTRAGITPA